MKKIIGIILLTVLTITLVGCKEEDPVPNEINCEVMGSHKDCKEEPDPDPDPELYCEDTQEDCIEKVEELIATMSLYKKVAQMVQAERGSITPDQVEFYGIGSILSGGGSHPSSYDNDIDDWYNMYKNYQNAALDSEFSVPLIYGIDAVHGNNNVYGSTIFPHNIGLGAANDPDLMYRISKATAEEMLTTGINYTFAPALSVVENIRWGRTYEGFSENPEIHMNLTYQTILGYEENGVSATAKHFFGDGGTDNGQDQGNISDLSEEELREIHLAPYYEAIRADVDTIMISYSSINGLKMHGSDYWINDVLKEEMGFEGFIISDWNAIHQLPGNLYSQVVASVNAGVDMLMEPYQWEEVINHLFDAVQNGAISRDRVDDAVRRILTVKYERGLFDDPTGRLGEEYLYNQEHQDIAREAVQKSLVLLQNDNSSLPLSKDEKIYITGPGSDNVGLMCGGWTTYWQGNTNADIGVGQSIKDAMQTILGDNGGMLVPNINDADTVIVVLAENPYAEGWGDNDQMKLTTNNAHDGNAAALAIAAQAQAQGKNVVGILISGRPLLLENYLSDFDSFVAAWLPGSEGGNGINDVLFGDYDFTGKLSFTWPVNYSQIGYTSNRDDYDETSVLFPYGYGLTYN